MNQENNKQLSKEQEEVLNSIQINKIIIPIVLGIGVILYLLWIQFDQEEFAKVNWSDTAVFWIVIACILLIIRHLAYAYRLKVLSQHAFDWWKAIELVFIWEFSSAVSPTSLGGSAVALFMLAQEKLSAARTAVIVLYTVVSDTFMFMITLPLLFMYLGPGIIRPGLESLYDLDGWGITFLSVYFLMLIYGSFFMYGLVFRPESFRTALHWLSKVSWLNRFKKTFVDLGNDIVIASQELRGKNLSFHIGANMGTLIAWACRFLILNCLIIGIVENTPTDLWNQLMLYTRSKTMFLTTAFSPTPGGAGLAEIVFGGFLSDYVPEGIAIIIAFIWRLITYYVYLFAGVVIIPNWIRKVLNRRKGKS